MDRTTGIALGFLIFVCGFGVGYVVRNHSAKNMLEIRAASNETYALGKGRDLTGTEAKHRSSTNSARSEIGAAIGGAMRREDFVSVIQRAISRASYDRINLRTLRHAYAREERILEKFAVLKQALGLSDNEVMGIREVLDSACDEILEAERANCIVTYEAPARLRIDMENAKPAVDEILDRTRMDLQRLLGTAVADLTGEIIALDQFYMLDGAPDTVILTFERYGDEWVGLAVPPPGRIGPKDEYRIGFDPEAPSAVFGPRWSRILEESPLARPDDATTGG